MSEPVVRVGVAVFVWRDGKFLMIKRLNSHGHNTWTVPGGHVDFGETFAQTAVRETLEETGMHIDNVRFFALTEDAFPDHNKQYITIWVESDWVSGEPEITEPKKCVEHQWRDFLNLPSPLFEPGWTNLRTARPDLFV